MSQSCSERNFGLLAARPGDTDKPPALAYKDDTLSGSDNRRPALEIPLFCGCKGREIDQRCNTGESAQDGADISGLAIRSLTAAFSLLIELLLLLYFLCFLVHVAQKLTDRSPESPSRERESRVPARPLGAFLPP